MAHLVSSLPTLCTLLLLCFISGGTLNLVDGQAPGQGAWCIAKPSTPDDTLTENLDYACANIDCSITKEGGPCFEPQTLINHASVAMNLYYQSQGRHTWNCDFKTTAVISVTDPSFGTCTFLFNQTVKTR
ncbi:glucan endo-1,3-beta-D-glucosidase-like [Daucus carota subsp. sativus]|uniref:glucan endo-1,3-beta-D-glucosidase-like n=1 Tax=Daucus carota subsp. sativus TaxID=79200 RepID=UPI0007EFE8E1|nr:PREDICTED: glucan endo-1,3-beta-D-glucosidase-like [Daucus carota subsp. sativus]